MSVVVATPYVVSDFTWYPDSGAIRHMTNDLTRFRDCRVYNSSGKVVVGNVQSIPISCIGESTLSHGTRTLRLKDLLYVPNIRKKLLSIFNFVKDNRVFF